MSILDIVHRMSNDVPAEQRTRGHKKKERTRRHLIDAAIDVIAARGEAFSVSDLTKHAGVSNGTFYNYFEDREQLIDAVLLEILTTFARDSAEAVFDDDPAVRFATITAMALQRATTDGDEIRAMFRLEAVQRAMIDGQALHHMRSDLIAGATTGRFTTDVDDATLDIIVGTMLLAARRITAGTVAAEYPSRVIDQLLRMLGVAPDEARVIAHNSLATVSAATSD